MLATLFDFPFEDRSKLTRWSDIVFARLGEGIIESHEQRQEELMECLAYFTRLWKEREDNPVGNDFISMMIRGDATRDLSPQEYLGNILLLIVGGNDTTKLYIRRRSGPQSASPGVKSCDNPAVIPNMVSEIIRWVTPLAHMRRTVTKDYEFRGQQMKAGDKVIMWYASGNRDERSIKDPEKFLVDRERARNHISFGFGLHRCMGNRMADTLRVLWEEIQQRFERIEVMGPEVHTVVFLRSYRPSSTLRQGLRHLKDSGSPNIGPFIIALGAMPSRRSQASLLSSVNVCIFSWRSRMIATPSNGKS